LDIFDHAKPSGVREKSALMHDAQGGEQRATRAATFSARRGTGAQRQ